MNRAVFFVVMTTILAIISAACAQSDAGQQVAATDTTAQVAVQQLKVIVGAEPEVLDPGLAADSSPSIFLVNTFAGLVTLGDNDAIIPAVAEKWDISPDGLVYTFTLRDDALWSDGEKLTAADFEYAWKRVINPATASRYSWIMLPYIKNAQAFFDGEADIESVGIKAIDEKTLEVTLQQPTPYFLGLCSFWTYFPVREDIVSTDDNWFRNPATYVCNGPFVMSEYKFGESITVIPNPNYYNKDKVKLQQIRFDFVEDANTALSAYQTDAVDISEILPTSEIPNLKINEPGFNIVPKMQHIWINFNVNEAPVDDPRVRKALALAINRQQICDQVLQAGQIPATGLVPFGVRYGGEDFREAGGDYQLPATGDVPQAKALLAEAGYPDGAGFPTVVLKDNGKKYIEVIAAMWEEALGIEVEIRVQEWKVHITEVKAGDYVTSRGGWTGDYMHPTTFLDIYSENGINFSQWHNAAYQQLLKDAVKEQDSGKHLQLLHLAEDIFMAEMPIAPIYYSTTAILVNPAIKGWRKSPLGYLFLSGAYRE